MRMFGSDGGIVEPRRNRPAVADLAVLVLQHIGFGAMQDSRTAAKQGRAMLGTVQTLARCLDSDQSDIVIDEVGEQPDGVRSAADAGDD